MFLSRQEQHHRPANGEELEDDPLALFEQTLYTKFNSNRLKTFLLKHKRDERYRNSPRYLRLWIMYALYLKTAYILPILHCLIDNHIGDKLAMSYVATAFYQVKQNKFKEAEDILLLGIKQRAEPTKRLEHALNQLNTKKTIPFDVNQYTIKTHQHQPSSLLRLKESLLSLKIQSFENHLKLLDVGLEHSIRASVLRECHQTKDHTLSFEELRAKHLQQEGSHLHRASLFLHEAKNDLDDICSFAIKRRTMTVIRKKITPPTPRALSPQRTTTAPLLPQSQIEPTIPTNPQEETANVTQLPHKSGFIQFQISSHGLLQRDDYHIFKRMKAQDIQNKLRAWSATCKKHQQRVIQLGDESYHVVQKLGEGGMARVYLVQDTNNHSYYGLKVQQPPHPWEFYIITQLHERRKNIEQHQYYLHVLPVHHFYQYEDISFLVMPYIKDGTLLDTLNLYRNHLQEQAMPEFLVLLFTLQLLKEITMLHSFHITHNDLKLDNIMLTRRESDRRKQRLPTVFMVDYGRSIDLTVLESIQCKANWQAACPQSDYPFLNQTHNPLYADYWQFATMMHLLLFGDVLKYQTNKRDGTFKIQQSIKRYWHKDLWVNFFHTMLNPQRVIQDNHDAIHDLICNFEKYQDDVPHTLIQSFHDLLDKN